jgi:hypothetical protein
MPAIAQAPTDAQRNFLASLAATAYGADAAAYLLKVDEMITDRRAFSQEIDRVKPLADAARRTQRAAAAAKVTEDLAIGMYRNPETAVIYRVVKSRESGRLYAKRLTVLNANSASFSYDGGAIYRIKPEWRLSLDDAKAWGLHYGICCVCAANLSDPKSVAEGIGPVCAKRV